MTQLKDKLERFLSVTLKSSNTPRLLSIYVSFFCDLLRKRYQVRFSTMIPKYQVVYVCNSENNHCYKTMLHIKTNAFHLTTPPQPNQASTELNIWQCLPAKGYFDCTMPDSSHSCGFQSPLCRLTKGRQCSQESALTQSKWGARTFRTTLRSNAGPEKSHFHSILSCTFKIPNKKPLGCSWGVLSQPQCCPVLVCFVSSKQTPGLICMSACLPL